MRKFLLSMALVLCSIGAMAQNAVTTIDVTKYYTLKCNSDASDTNHGTNQFIGVTDAGIIDGKSSTGTFITFETGDVENSYYIKVGEKYINYSDSLLSASTEKSTVWVLGSVNNLATFNISGTTLYLNNNGTVADSTITNLKANNHTNGPSAANACSTWEMKEYTRVSTIDNFENGKTYTFVTVRGWMGASATSSNAISTAKVTGDTNSDYFKWAVYKTEKGIYLYNIGKQMFLGEQSTTKDASVPMSAIPAAVEFKVTGNADYPLMFKTTTDANCVINHSTSYGDGLITWNGGWADVNDTGNRHQITSASFVSEEVLTTIEATVNAYENSTVGDYNYSVTDDAGNVYEGTANGLIGFSSPSFTGATYTLADAVWDGTNYTAKINFAYPMSNKENGVTNEVLLAIFGNAKYLHAYDNDIKVQTTNVAAIDANCLWAVYPSLENGAFTFTIMNVATGKYVYSAAANNSSILDTEGTVILSETPSEFTIGASNNADNGKSFKFANMANLYLSINSGRDTDVYLGVHRSVHGGTDIQAIALPQYEVAITEAKYATFYAPYAVSVPEGVTAHAVTINGEWATLGDALDIIPAYTGVVLYSETVNTYTFPVTTTENVVESDLRGTVATTYVADDAYVLANGDNSIGFYLAEMNNADKTAFLNNHHKAYLPKPTGAENVACYSFRFDGTTGVEKVEIRNEKEEIYDLTGRRVNSMNAAGIYIVNGRKVLVK